MSGLEIAANYAWNDNCYGSELQNHSLPPKSGSQPSIESFSWFDAGYEQNLTWFAGLKSFVSQAGLIKKTKAKPNAKLYLLLYRLYF